MPISVAWTAIVDGQVDADSPLNQLLMQAIKDDLYHLKYWLGKNYTAVDDHDHDGANSKTPVLANDSVTQAKIAAAAVGQGELKTGYSYAGVSGVGDGYAALTGGYYSLCIQSDIKSNGNLSSVIVGLASYHATYGWIGMDTSNVTLFDLYVSYHCEASAPMHAYGQNYYVSASDIYSWLFILAINGEFKHFGFSDDHPRFGTLGRREHPFGSGDSQILQGFYNQEFADKDVDLIVINPTIAEVERIKMGTLPTQDGGYMSPAKAVGGIEVDYDRQRRSVHEAFNDIYEINQYKEADWVSEPISIGLPHVCDGRLISDWRTMPREIFNKETEKMEPFRVSSIKKVIKKPDYIVPLSISERIK